MKNWIHIHIYISRIYKNLLKPIRKSHKPIEKWAKDLNSYFSKEETTMANKHRKTSLVNVISH